MKLKRVIAYLIYFFLNHESKRKVFKETFKTKLVSSKSFIFFSNQTNKDLRSSTKYFFYKQNISKNIIFYVCSDALEEFYSIAKKINKKFILITGDSDRTISSKLKIYTSILKNKNLIMWFAQNCINTTKKIKQIPIGLDYISQFHDTHKFKLNIINKNLLPLSYEKKLLNIIKHSPNFESRKNLIFCNFHFNINSKDRSDCLKNIDQNLCFFLKKKISYIKNFKQQSEYKFVLAPQGAGIDTHRVWEAILFGNIPIIKSSPLNKLYKDFPVLIVKSWKDVTHKKLIFYSKKFSNPVFSYEKLLLIYWKKKILKYEKKIQRLKNYETFKGYLLKKYE